MAEPERELGSMKRLPILFLVVTLALVGGLPVAPVQAQSGNQWQIDFFPTSDWSGAPVYTQFSNAINFNWSAAAPGPNIPADYWTARMTSNAFFYAGSYLFTALADDEFVVSIDNVVYYDTRNAAQSGKQLSFVVNLAQGVHRIQMDYREIFSTAYVYLTWGYIKPELPPSVVLPPPIVIAPPIIVPTPPVWAIPVPPVTPPATLQNQYGDFTNCMAQNLHQAYCFQASGAWNSPNLGSIQMEPPIVLWGLCTADQVALRTFYPDLVVRNAKCSKSEAGWFPV
jgi:hypothetical protein